MTHGSFPSTPVSRESLLRFQSVADTLRWQARLRIALVAGLMVVGGALRAGGMLEGSAATLAVLGGAYLALTAAIGVGLGRRSRWSRRLLPLTLATDLAFIFSSTLLATSPAHVEAALFLAFFTIHLTLLSFGRRVATWTLMATAVCYTAMLHVADATGRGAARSEDLWILVLFCLGVYALIVQHGHVQRRLAVLAALFERAEAGEFADAYDISADARPDSITMVGRAYNRFRSQLATLVLTDQLSGCLNRRGFEQQCERELARAARSGGELAMLALDIDDFKEINDGYGHLVGDAVIREIGVLLRGSARGGDVVARLGGDEFALLLPDTGEDGAQQLAFRVEELVRQHHFTALNGAVRLTISIGIATDRARRDGIAEALRARADEALYAAKRAGRGEVRVWRHGVRGGPAGRVAGAA